ncbi:MAG TPA: hypothetical protein PLP17_01970, partial [Oligoflexia bacterium]|nr:hypothetical protein [Oligoflexia bacterium]
MEQVAESFFRTVSSASDSDKKPAERIFRNEKKWNKFFSVDLLDALPDLQSDLSGNEESVSLEQYIFFIERSLARTVMNKNPLFAADLLCRKPLIFFGFEKQLAANISSDALPRSYYTMLAHSLASFVAELVDFPMDQRIVLFLRAVRSPYRAACDFAERERNSHLFFLRGKAKFYDILVDSTIAELKLEKRHYTSKLYPDGRMAVAPFAELTLEALALLRARHHSESFFRSLPQRLLTSLESSDSRLAAKLKDDPGPQFFENPGLVSFEFPEQQSLHMLRAKAIGLRLAYEQVSAKDNVADAPDLLRRDLAETLTLLQFSAAQAYRECLWDIERAQSVCSLLPQLEQSQPNLKDRLREEFLLASQDQERSIIRKSELEAYLTSIPEELFRLHKSALPDAKTAHSSELHLTKESIMDSLLLQQSLLRIIDQSGTTLAAFGKEKRTNTLLDALTSAAAELLPALKDELTRILKPLAVKDPFSASKLDVPDPFGATVQRFAAALKNEEQSTLL